MTASGQYGKSRLCAGIVGHADLRLGDGVARVLEAEVAAGDGRFRGIRHCRNGAAQLRVGKDEIDRLILRAESGRTML
jgi:hypothetical protein